MNKKSGRGRRPGSPDTQEAIRQAARDAVPARRLPGRHACARSRPMRAWTSRSSATTSGPSRDCSERRWRCRPTRRSSRGRARGRSRNPARTAPAVALLVWDSPETGAPLRALAGNAASDPELNRLCVRSLAARSVDQLAAHLATPDARQRAAAFATQVAGLIFSRYVFQFEPMASMHPDDIVTRLGAIPAPGAVSGGVGLS